ncbi:MAG: energy transducer TonB [Fluviicola sp.]
MKKILLLASLLLTVTSFSQEKVTTSEPELAPLPPKTEEVKIYDIVDEPAQFPGGQEALMKFFKENIKYPESALKNKKEGKCYLKFIVSETGIVSDVKVVRGVMDCPECDAEAVRVLKLMPNWEPGKIDRKPVRQTMMLPVLFRI